jgi:hypothetical protein
MRSRDKSTCVLIGEESAAGYQKGNRFAEAHFRKCQDALGPRAYLAFLAASLETTGLKKRLWSLSHDASRRNFRRLVHWTCVDSHLTPTVPQRSPSKAPP